MHDEKMGGWVEDRVVGAYGQQQIRKEKQSVWSQERVYVHTYLQRGLLLLRRGRKRGDGADHGGVPDADHHAQPFA